MLRTEFEDILILETPYYQKLKKLYRDTTHYHRYIEMLEIITPDDDFVKVLKKRGGKELVYLGRKIFSLQEEFVSNYLEFMSNQTFVNKWENFFERYSKALFDIYEQFVTDNKYHIFIFEIVNRKLLRDVFTKHTVREPVEQKAVYSERLGVVINQLFNYLRNSLSKNLEANASLLTNSYEKIPFIPLSHHAETMKLCSKLFLSKGMPEPLFTAIAKQVMSSHYQVAKEKVMKLIEKLDSVDKESLRDIFHANFFFPDDATLEDILRLTKKQGHEKLEVLRKKRAAVDKKILSIKRKIKETTDSLKEQLVHLTENFSTEEPIDSMVKKMRRNLLTNGYDLRLLKNQLQDFVHKEQELKSIMNYKSQDLRKFIKKNEWDPYLILLMNRKKSLSNEKIQAIAKEISGNLKNDKNATEVIGKYKITGFLKDSYDTKKINSKFQEITKEIIEPLVRGWLLEELVEYYPKLSGALQGEGIRYLAEEALRGSVNMIEKDIEVTPKRSEVSTSTVSQFRNLVSVLNYDIRGSTFMGTKLRDAKRESEIRNYFQESMLAVVDKFGGIPIKDTGDGGIALFAANGSDIKNNETTKLEPGSMLSAVRCGIALVLAAKDFVQDNIDKYKDWFVESEDRKIDFEGATYATLSPTYQSIFQIGVGIASGKYPAEIFLDKNAYGELDLTGMIVREANFYSKVKAKSKSTVICDDATVYNLLLNVNKFSFLSEAGLRIDPLLLDIEQGLEYWINQKTTRRGFIMDLYKIFVSQLGQEVTRPGSLKIMLGIFDIELDETGEIKDGKGGRGKFLFEVTSEK